MLAAHPAPAPHALRCLFDLTPHLAGLHLVAVEVGPDHEILALLHEGSPDYRERRGGSTFARRQTARPHTFVVLRAHNGNVLRTTIPEERWNFDTVQPLPGGELLLACSRCLWAPEGKHERNARVYGLDGSLRREFLLGDGLARVQTTRSGKVWTSFQGEGVFGNFGWRHPGGASGLVAWDSAGREVYSFRPPPGHDSICDCYALNVPGDREAWVHYSTEFPLVRVERGGETTAWRCPAQGADAFAVADNLVLLRGGHDDRGTCRLFALEPDGGMALRRSFAFTDEAGAPLEDVAALGRGPALYFVRGARVYAADVRELA